MPEPFEFTDRYQALGIPYPDASSCKGDCEGTGVVPIYRDERDPAYAALWQRAHDKAHTLRQRVWDAIRFRNLSILTAPCDRTHFVPCFSCNGTGKARAR